MSGPHVRTKGMWHCDKRYFENCTSFDKCRAEQHDQLVAHMATVLYYKSCCLFLLYVVFVCFLSFSFFAHAASDSFTVLMIIPLYFIPVWHLSLIFLLWGWHWFILPFSLDLRVVNNTLHAFLRYVWASSPYFPIFFQYLLKEWQWWVWAFSLATLLYIDLTSFPRMLRNCNILLLWMRAMGK